MSALCINVFHLLKKKIWSLMSKQISAQKNAEGTNPEVCQLFEIAPFLIEMVFKNYELNTSKTCTLNLKPSFLISFSMLSRSYKQQ